MSTETFRIVVGEKMPYGAMWPPGSFDEVIGKTVTYKVTDIGTLIGVDFSPDRTTARLTIEITDPVAVAALTPDVSHYSIGVQP